MNKIILLILIKLIFYILILYLFYSFFSKYRKNKFLLIFNNQKFYIDWYINSSINLIIYHKCNKYKYGLFNTKDTKVWY